MNPTATSDVGFSIGDGQSASNLRVAFADGVRYERKQFSHARVPINVNTRRMVRIVKIPEGGREVTVFVNGAQVGTQLFSVNGSIYDNVKMVWGNVWGWRFIGTLTSLILRGRDEDHK